ncbi:MAG: 50S ribosomal protein L29 [Candidatus Taylorbacteria bacterium]|nr:50S ribosomal protein L29 [Candidatus Taylorbacteria bacterium]
MKDYKGKTVNELEKELISEQETLRVFRFEMSGSKIKNVKTGKNIRANIARILTEINAQPSK